MAETNPDDGEHTQPASLAEKLSKWPRLLGELALAEAGYDAARQNLRDIMGIYDEPFVVEVDTDNPLTEAYIYESLDEPLIERQPKQFVATEPRRIGDGSAEFLNRKTGQILRVSGGYNFRLRPVIEEQSVQK